MGASSCFQPEEDSQPSVTNRRRKSHQGDDIIRYMYFCYPSPDGGCLSELTVRTKDDRPTDRVLIESLKKEYNSLRPYYVRLRSLRGFSAIRLARVCATVISFRGANTDMCQFKYYVMIDSKIPKAVDWKWPDPTKCDWESTGGLDDLIDDSGLSQLMLHLWMQQCHTDKKENTLENEKEGWVTLLIMSFKDKTRTIPLHTSGAPPPLGLRDWPRHNTLSIALESTEIR